MKISLLSTISSLTELFFSPPVQTCPLHHWSAAGNNSFRVKFGDSAARLHIQSVSCLLHTPQKWWMCFELSSANWNPYLMKEDEAAALLLLCLPQRASDPQTSCCLSGDSPPQEIFPAASWRKNSGSWSDTEEDRLGGYTKRYKQQHEALAAVWGSCRSFFSVVFFLSVTLKRINSSDQWRAQSYCHSQRHQTHLQWRWGESEGFFQSLPSLLWQTQSFWNTKCWDAAASSKSLLPFVFVVQRKNRAPPAEGVLHVCPSAAVAVTQAGKGLSLITN